jgi:hypothetical protein
MTILHHDRLPTRSERIMGRIVGLPIVFSAFGFLLWVAVTHWSSVQ